MRRRKKEFERFDLKIRVEPCCAATAGGFPGLGLKTGGESDAPDGVGSEDT